MTVWYVYTGLNRFITLHCRAVWSIRPFGKLRKHQTNIAILIPTKSGIYEQSWMRSYNFTHCIFLESKNYSKQWLKIDMKIVVSNNCHDYSNNSIIVSVFSVLKRFRRPLVKSKICLTPCKKFSYSLVFK